VLDSEAAQDAAQEAMFRAWRRAETCRGSPEAWIRTIAFREALRAARRGPEELVSEIDEISGPIDPSDAAERLDVTRELARLSTEQQRTLLLRYWGDRTEQDIAVLLGVPLGTVKVRIHRALKKLGPGLTDQASSI
jgi:RNA polymerase sigma-70 factor (ECF subfamily)